jgi:hypothetical protein
MFHQFTRPKPLKVIPNKRKRYEPGEEDVEERLCFVPNRLVDHPQSAQGLEHQNRFDQHRRPPEFLMEWVLERGKENHSQPERDGQNR